MLARAPSRAVRPTAGGRFRRVPAAVLGGKALTQIAADDATACALDSAGAAYCWGDNDYGEFGDGSFTSSSVPVAVDTSGVLAGKTLTKISAAFNTACVLDSAGAAYCWGRSDQGQLGDGSTTNSSVPVAVDTGGALAGKTLTQISVGMYGDVCALDSAGAAYCWGGSSRSTVPVALDTWVCPQARPLPRSALAAETRVRWTVPAPHTAGAPTRKARSPWTHRACWPARPLPRSALAISTRVRWTVPVPPIAGQGSGVFRSYPVLCDMWC